MGVEGEFNAWTARPHADVDKYYEKSDKIKLRFPEVYRSAEWQALPSLDRAQLLLVAEGLKPGAIIGGNFTGFQKIVGRLGLVTHLNSRPGELNPVYEVATQKAMDAYYNELVNMPEEAPQSNIHLINGRFLGYPACCTEEYIKPQKNRDAVIREYPDTHEDIPNIEYEVRKIIQQGGSYPAELDAAPPTFTPCSVTCPHALARLKKWSVALLTADPEAARDLQLFHWQSKPYRGAHEEEICALERQEKTAAKLEFLRRSAGREE